MRSILGSRLKKREYACFDIFDTVLFRSVMAPSDVFKLVYRTLVASDHIDPNFITECAFVSARKKAETAIVAIAEECSLSEIWASLESHLGLECSKQGMAAEELAERMVLYPNREIVGQIEARRSDGAQIVFISDMYLSARFLKTLLKDLGIWNTLDRIFVSSETGETKRTGALYKRVMNELGGQPKDFHMTGDNRQSDVLSAKKHGWRATHYKGQKLNKYEQRLHSSLQLEPFCKSALVGAIKKVRCSSGASTSRFIGDFLGPASFLWALWAVKTAESLGVENLKFAARDGYQAWIAAKILHDRGVTGVMSQYLYVSRASLSFADLRDISEVYDRVIAGTKIINVRGIARSLEVSEQNFLEKIRCKIDVEAPLSKQQIAEIKEKVLSSDLKESVLSIAKEHKRLTQEYLAQECIVQNDSWALVDIGWHLSVQSQLSRLLPKQEMRGLYLYLSEDRASPTLSGFADTMMHTKFWDSNSSELPEIWRHATISEHLLSMAPHGSTVGYLKDGDNIYPKTYEISCHESAAKSELSLQLSEYIRDNLNLLNSAFVSKRECARAFRTLSDTFIKEPEHAAIIEIVDFFSIGTSATNDEDYKPLEPIGIGELASELLKRAIFRPGRKSEWLSARLVLSGPFAKPLLLILSLLHHLKKKLREK